MKLTILFLFALNMSLQANDWTGWSDELFFPTEKRISYRTRCNNSPNDGRHEWQVKFKNLTSAKLTFSFGIGADSSVKLNKQMDLGGGKEDWNWELLALACDSEAWVTIKVSGSKAPLIQKINDSNTEIAPQPKKAVTWDKTEKGAVTWFNAVENCNSKGMRLPTREELMAVASKKVKWGNMFYWSSDEVDSEYALLVDIVNGKEIQMEKKYAMSSDTFYVKCIK